MSDDIKKNFVYLTENLTNLPKILTYLVQESILSEDERERISNKETTLDSSTLLWSLLKKKDWKNKKAVVIEILRKTNNEHCAEVIERNPSNEPEGGNFHLILQKKWWPTEKFLPRAFQQRNREDGKKSLVYHLMEQIKKSKNASTVISQGTAVSGLGGVGKTTTAIWFAKHFADLYEHILWIDCGEKSLISSFIALALELKIEKEFDLQRLAVECFSKFENIPCLCVFDNAECYQGDQGIRDVLPKLPNMHCIITSRTTLWGTETGDGNIPQLHLNAFNSNDGVTFLKRHLKQADDKKIEEKLKELSEILGNLPLALQIAVTAINTKKIDLKEYIHRIKTTPHIINESFDNYEKTINLSLKISMDLIKGHQSDHAEIAYNILLILGYIRPDDVDLELFKAIEKSSAYEVEEAIDLLKGYSLVTTSIKDEGGNYIKAVSIHRLLQQVIRYNSQAEKKELICKILSCKELSDYDKVIPFSYASAEVQNKFPDLRLKFTDLPQLSRLIEEFRFTEAVKLSLIIKTYIKSLTADYNYAVCLEKCREFKMAIGVLHGVYNSMLEDFDSHYEWRWGNTEIESPINKLGLCLKENVKLKEVCGLLFLLNLKSGNVEKALQITTQQKVLVAGNSSDAVDHFIRFFSFSSISQYKIYIYERWVTVELNCLASGKSLSLDECSFSGKFPNDLQELNLKKVNFLTESGACLSRHDITDNISSNLKKLKILNSGQTKFIFDVDSIVHYMEMMHLQGSPEINLKGNCKWNVNELTLVDMGMSLLAKESEMKITRLRLERVTLDLTTLVNISQSVEQMELKNVKIMKEEDFLSNGILKLNVPKLNLEIDEDFYAPYTDVRILNLVNNNLNFHAINELTLDNNSSRKENIILNFQLLPAEMEKVTLNRIKVTNWEISKCTINELKLKEMDISDITKTEMKVNNLFLYDTTINSAVLFQMCAEAKEVKIIYGKIILNRKLKSETFQLLATKVILYRVKFVTKKFFLEKSLNVIVNEIINIPYLKELSLDSSGDSKLTLKMNEPAQFDTLFLGDVELKNFYECEWNVNKMELRNFTIVKKLKMQISTLKFGYSTIQKLIMQISKLTFGYSKIDLSCLPINLKKIHLAYKCDIVCSKPLNLPELNFVSFNGESCRSLKYFANCNNLMTIQFTHPEFPTDWEMDIGYPINVRTIIFNHLYGNQITLRELQILLNGFTNVDTLVFNDYPFQLLKLILSNYNTESVTFNNREKEISFGDLTVVAELLKKQKSKVSFKRIFWIKQNPNFFELHGNRRPSKKNNINILENGDCDETENVFKVEGEYGLLDGWWAQLRAYKK